MSGENAAFVFFKKCEICVGDDSNRWSRESSAARLTQARNLFRKSPRIDQVLSPLQCDLQGELQIPAELYIPWVVAATGFVGAELMEAARRLSSRKLSHFKPAEVMVKRMVKSETRYIQLDYHTNSMRLTCFFAWSAVLMDEFKFLKVTQGYTR